MSPATCRQARARSARPLAVKHTGLLESLMSPPPEMWADLQNKRLVYESLEFLTTVPQWLDK